MPDGESFRPRLLLASAIPSARPRPQSADDAARLVRRLDPETRRALGLEDDDAWSFERPERADGAPTLDLVAEVISVSAR